MTEEDRTIQSGDSSPGSAGGDFDATEISDAAPDSVAEVFSNDRFRKVRWHAEGGLGRVFLADDADLFRRVALKEIQPRFSFDDAVRARFVREARITGSLEHPGVVPVYALGAYPDGRPFYAMRFIQGESLKDAIDRFFEGRGQADETTRDATSKAPASDAAIGDRPAVDYSGLEFRSLLRRLIDVCNAIAYAHDRGVIHRDIKPGNIMLGAYGETLVVDWGLAKSLEDKTDESSGTSTDSGLALSGSVETAPGSTVGTPAFMSPEQACSDLAAIGPASDIYSLGATLYRLLTGKNAFEQRDIASLGEKVVAGDFPRPRTIQTALPRPLEAICLKAMARHAEDRYATARELAVDLERWLADEPVGAWREPWRFRAARWTRKHQSAVLGAGGAAAAAIAALAVVAAVISRTNSRLIAANAEVVQANARESEQRRLAELRFEQARNAVDEFLADVRNDVRLKQNEPIAMELRKQLLAKAQSFYADFLTQAGEDVRLRRHSALAAARLASLHLELSPSPQVAGWIQKAEEIQRTLHAEAPENEEFAQDLHATLVLRAELESKTGDLKASRNSLEQAIALIEPFAANEGGPKRTRSDLARSLFVLGRIDALEGKFANAIARLERSASLLQPILETDAEDVNLAFDLARNRANAGIFLAQADDLDKAEESLNDAEMRLRTLEQKFPYLLSFAEERGRNAANQANLAGMKGRHAEAIAALQRSHEIFGRLSREFPNLSRLAQFDGSACNNLGYFLQQAGRGEEADAAYRSALVIREKLVRDSPQVVEYCEELATTLINLANLIRDTGQAEASLAFYRKAVDALASLQASQPTNARLRTPLRNAHWGRGEALSRLRRSADALPEWDAALALDSGAGRRQLTVSRALTLARLGRHAEAVEAAKSFGDDQSMPDDLAFTAARAFAAAAAAAEKDITLPTMNRQSIAADCVARALGILNRLRERNALDLPERAAVLSDDEDFMSLRKSPEGKQFLKI